MITAYPTTNDPVIVSLVEHLNKCCEAGFYVELRNSEAGSGFFSHAATKKEARAEARAHLKRYPTWETATLYHAHRGERLQKITTIRRKQCR